MRSFVLAGVAGFFAVFFGAFGSHVLKSMLSEKSFSVFHTANQYHFWHTLAIFAVAILRDKYPHKFFTASIVFFSAGLILFSGSLYVYAIYGQKVFAMIAPLGGTAFMAGWLFVIMGSIRVFSRK